MADTTLTLAEIRTQVFLELGSPQRDLPDSASGTIDKKISLAARTILASISGGDEAILDSITCVADQQSYDIPDNREIIEVFWGPETTQDFFANQFVRQFGDIPNSQLDLGAFVWRSDALIQDIREKQYRESSYFYEILAGKIYVTPTPTSDTQKIYYLYASAVGDVTSLTKPYEQAIIYLATSLCARVLANRYRGKVGPATREGLSNYEKTPEWDSIADRYKELYEEEMQTLA